MQRFEVRQLSVVLCRLLQVVYLRPLFISFAFHCLDTVLNIYEHGNAHFFLP